MSDAPKNPPSIDDLMNDDPSFEHDDFFDQLDELQDGAQNNFDDDFISDSPDDFLMDNAQSGDVLQEDNFFEAVADDAPHDASYHETDSHLNNDAQNDSIDNAFKADAPSDALNDASKAPVATSKKSLFGKKEKEKAPKKQKAPKAVKQKSKSKFSPAGLKKDKTSAKVSTGDGFAKLASDPKMLNMVIVGAVVLLLLILAMWYFIVRTPDAPAVAPAVPEVVAPAEPMQDAQDVPQDDPSFDDEVLADISTPDALVDVDAIENAPIPEDDALIKEEIDRLQDKNSRLDEQAKLIDEQLSTLEELTSAKEEQIALLEQQIALLEQQK